MEFIARTTDSRLQVAGLQGMFFSVARRSHNIIGEWAIRREDDKTSYVCFGSWSKSSVP